MATIERFAQSFVVHCAGSFAAATASADAATAIGACGRPASQVSPRLSPVRRPLDGLHDGRALAVNVRQVRKSGERAD